ncbi:MAG: hypothetical protein Q9227_008209 [Pyrenula ochraceoflavens]
MPRAEAGTTKALSNNLKSKGLQRLRWFCQPCSRQMRDENGFKMHCQSEGHVRQMAVIGEDPRKAINEFSRQFERDFLNLLKTGHGEKRVHANRFYQEYISDKNHVHQNSTKWASLTEFVKHIGREGLCRVDEEESDESGRGGGLYISWIDNSPEALRRQDALRKKERQDKGDEEREQRAIEAQIERARQDRTGGDRADEDEVEEDKKRQLQRKEGEKITLNFGAKPVAKPPSPPLTEKSDEEKERQRTESASSPPKSTEYPTNSTPASKESSSKSSPPPPSKAPDPPMTTKPTLTFGPASTNKPKNVFAAPKKNNPLASSKKSFAPTQQRPMSEAERIMKEELERKRIREEKKGFAPGMNPAKKQRVG